MQLALAMALAGMAVLLGSPAAQAQAFDPGTQSVAYVEVRGEIRDAVTAAPVAGASVMAFWEAASYGYHSTNRHCLRMAATRTDSQGQFSMVAPLDAVFRKGLAQQFVDIRIHGAGLEERSTQSARAGRTYTMKDEKRAAFAAFLQGTTLTQRHLSVVAILHHSRKSPDERLRELRSISDRTNDCETSGPAEPIRSFFDGVAAEGKAIAKSNYERGLAEVLAYRAENGAALKASHMNRGEEAIMLNPSRAVSPVNEPNSRNHRDETQLMIAAFDGDAKLVAALLAAGADANRLRGNQSALTVAMENYFRRLASQQPGAERHKQVIEILLAPGVTNPDLRSDPQELTPLMRAVGAGGDDIVALLLDAGAEPNLTAQGNETFAIRIAVERMRAVVPATRQPHPAVTRQFERLLAVKTLDLNRVSSYDGHTVLTESLARGDVGMARRLLQAGADPNGLAGAKCSPLSVATLNAIPNKDHSEFVEAVRLMANWPGVRGDLRCEGKTALELARARGREDLVQVLSSVR